MYSVEIVGGRRFGVTDGETILEAAARAGVKINYSCKTGRCSACKCKVMSGETSAKSSEMGLSDQEKCEGWILSCVRSVNADLVLDVEDLSGLHIPPSKTLPCRISQLNRLTKDVMQVFLRLPTMAEFRFIPGQYIEIIGPNGMRRSYSMANGSVDGKLIELHIRAIEGGTMSQYWFSQAKVNDLLRLNGPLGTFFLRDVIDKNLIFLATGTGIAPIKAMLESMKNLAKDHLPNTVTVIWGGRTQKDLYFDMEGKSYSYIPVLSRAGNEWNGARGYVQDIVVQLNANLVDSAVYACGSDAMIKSARNLLFSKGLSPKLFYSDAFVCSDPTFAQKDD